MSTQIADNLNIPNDQWITASVWGTGNVSSNFSESLTTNSTWSQTGGGPAIGAIMAIYSKNSVYSGGSGGSSSYSGGQNWTWSDPNLSTYDAHALSEIRITPNGPAEIGPVMFRSAPNVAAVMPPSLVEDTEAAAVEEGEESAIGRFLWSLVPGSLLVGAYRDYKKGSYVSAALNGLFGLADLTTVGSLVKVRSSLKLLVGFMKVRVKDSVVDAVSNEAGNLVAERYGPEAGFAFETFVSAKLSKNVSQQNKTQLGFAADGEQNRQVPKAFQVAADGGRHAGFLKNRLGRSSESLLSEAKTLRQRATEHQVKINKRIGFGKVSDEPIFQYRADAGRIKHLEKEIQNFLEQAEIVEELARRTIGGNL